MNFLKNLGKLFLFYGLLAIASILTMISITITSSLLSGVMPDFFIQMLIMPVMVCSIIIGCVPILMLSSLWGWDD